jgi:hypothetical protein
MTNTSKHWYIHLDIYRYRFTKRDLLSYDNTNRATQLSDNRNANNAVCHDNDFNNFRPCIFWPRLDWQSLWDTINSSDMYSGCRDSMDCIEIENLSQAKTSHHGRSTLPPHERTAAAEGIRLYGYNVKYVTLYSAETSIWLVFFVWKRVDIVINRMRTIIITATRVELCWVVFLTNHNEGNVWYVEPKVLLTRASAAFAVHR